MSEVGDKIYFVCNTIVMLKDLADCGNSCRNPQLSSVDINSNPVGHLAGRPPNLRALWSSKGSQVRRAGLDDLSNDGMELLFETGIPVRSLKGRDQGCLMFYLSKYDCEESVSLVYRISELNANLISGYVWAICWAVMGMIF